VTIREFFGTFLGMNRIIKESQKGKFIKEFLTLVRHLTMRPAIAALRLDTQLLREDGTRRLGNRVDISSAAY